VSAGGGDSPRPETSSTVIDSQMRAIVPIMADASTHPASTHLTTYQSLTTVVSQCGTQILKNEPPRSG